MEAPIARPRPLGLTFLFAIYLASAAAMLAFCARPALVLGDASADQQGATRLLFAIAACVCAAIGLASFRRARWVRPAALAVHALVALIALAGLASLAAGRPLFDGGIAELVAKTAVHAALAALWWSRPLRAHFA